MITPVVQVITTGTDWPAIVAAISGGVVGLAGIGSTIWVATRSISAENKRVLLAEKRRIYACHMTACAQVRMLRIKLNMPEADKRSANFELGAAIAAVAATRSEVQLIAPEEIGHLAYLAANAATHLPPTDKDVPDDYFDLRDRLLRAMRDDLGLPDEPATLAVADQFADPAPGGG